MTETFFLDDGSDEIAEYNSANAVTAHYVPGPAIDEPIAVTTGTSPTYTHQYFHANHQGSIVAMSDDTGTRIGDPYTYDPYGNCVVGSTPCPITGEPYRFTGQRADPETGLLFYRARMYWPGGGRFLQTDPVGYAADMNVYTYVENDPTDMVDPTGRDQVCVAPTGSRIASSCVNVNGDKKTLTVDQKSKIGHDFRSFILGHSGKDITANGASVSGGSQGDRDFVSAISQFVGTAVREWSGHGWNGIGISLLNSFGMQQMEGEFGHGESDYGYANGNMIDGIQFRELDLNTDKRSTFHSAGNAARVLMHERLHFLWSKDHNNPGAALNDSNGEHTALDSQARGLLKSYGLSNGGCDPMGDYPSCD